MQSNAEQQPPFPLSFRETTEEESPTDDNRCIIKSYPRVNGLSARVVSSRRIDLNDSRTIELELRSGGNDIRNGVLRIKPATAGLRLRISDMNIEEGSIKVHETTDLSHIEFESFGIGSFARFSIPYSLESHQMSLSVRLEVTYETENGRFSYASLTSIDTTLPVSVNVQDIFKEDALFSRFTISPSMVTPLRILGCRIPGSEVYDVQYNTQQGDILDVFPKQPASLLCRISQRNPGKQKQEDANHSLGLTLDFVCLDEECLLALKDQFIKSLEESDFNGLEQLLIPHLLEVLQSQWSASDLEQIGLVREIEVLPYERAQWQTVTGFLDEKLAKELTKWLMKWHEVR